MRCWRSARLVLVLAAVVAAAGCGYSLRASLPAGIKTVHIPTLENRTQEPGIEDFVTQALTQAVVTSGLVRIARNAADADATLEGQIIEYNLSSLAFDRTANVTQYRLRIALALTLRDLRKNEVLWRQERIEERADFNVAGQVSTNLSREEQAVRRAAVDVSRAIVSFAFEGF
jgi:outer membrane lipopolysaccharide assembly protein LptE/RlpB